MICTETPKEIIMEQFSMGEHWGIVELMQRYPIQNSDYWIYDCDPMDVNGDPDVAKKITCISETDYDPWFRKMIPWKWRSHEQGKDWDFPTPHLFLNNKKRYALSERYTSVDRKHIRLYKREYNFYYHKSN